MTTQERAWRVGTFVGVMLAIFLIAVSVKEFRSIGYVGKDTNIVSTIAVTGKGEIVTIPDVATFSFTVTETAKTVAEAQANSTTRTNAALKAVRDAGVADSDIKTTAYNINPHYEYQNGVCTATYCMPSKSTLTGYDVSQTIQVKIRDLSKAGSIFGSIGTVGVQDVNGLTFTVDDIDSVKAQAREKAIADAKAKADQLARQLGVRLVRITSYYDMSNEPIPYGYGRGGDMATANVKLEAAPEIPSGEQKISSNVTITYEIK